MVDSWTMLRRLDDVSERLAALSSAGDPGEKRTEADAVTGERWDRGQAWAHLAEFVPYWIAQATYVISSYDGEPVPFGRTKSDEGRVAAIARDRSQPITVLWADTHSDIEELREFLLRLDDQTWDSRGLHPALGVMPLERIIDEFLIGHLEEHASQLERLNQGG